MEKPSEVPASLPSLKEALRRARMASAEKSGVLVELRTAELARLDLLKEELQPIFAEIPQDVDLFDAAIMPGDPARLFIDVLGFVEMGRDKRTYLFFHDTRYGRKLIDETDKLPQIIQAITDYVAHRLVEREKALISDTMDMRTKPFATMAAPRSVSTLSKVRPQTIYSESKGWGWIFLFVFTAALLFGYWALNTL